MCRWNVTDLMSPFTTGKKRRVSELQVWQIRGQTLMMAAASRMLTISSLHMLGPGCKWPETQCLQRFPATVGEIYKSRYSEYVSFQATLPADTDTVQSRSTVTACWLVNSQSHNTGVCAHSAALEFFLTKPTVIPANILNTPTHVHVNKQTLVKTEASSCYD